MDSLNVRYWVATAHVPTLRDWARLDAMANHYLPALGFPCPGGRSVTYGDPCFDMSMDFPDLTWLRREVEAGRIKAFGEVLLQYMGLGPGDPRMEPYWALAEEFDIPVGIHMGPGPPGAAYESSPVPMKHPNFRMAQGDPMLLEEVLLRHKRLRLWVMHAGWPRLDSMMALLYAHPNVYVDTGGLQSDRQCAIRLPRNRRDPGACGDRRATLATRLEIDRCETAVSVGKLQTLNPPQQADH